MKPKFKIGERVCSTRGHGVGRIIYLHDSGLCDIHAYYRVRYELNDMIIMEAEKDLVYEFYNDFLDRIEDRMGL